MADIAAKPSARANEGRYFGRHIELQCSSFNIHIVAILIFLKFSYSVDQKGTCERVKDPGSF